MMDATKMCIRDRFSTWPFSRASARPFSTVKAAGSLRVTVRSTLLRCLNFLETADAGQLVFDGESFDLAHASRTDIARLRKDVYKRQVFST